VASLPEGRAAAGSAISSGTPPRQRCGGRAPCPDRQLRATHEGRREYGLSTPVGSVPLRIRGLEHHYRAPRPVRDYLALRRAIGLQDGESTGFCWTARRHLEAPAGDVTVLRLRMVVLPQDCAPEQVDVSGWMRPGFDRYPPRHRPAVRDPAARLLARALTAPSLHFHPMGSPAAHGAGQQTAWHLRLHLPACFG